MDNQKEKFYDTVKRMREAQKDYFKTRDRRIMTRAIMLEGVVDEMIKEHYVWLKDHPQQLSLFQDKGGE